VEAGTGAACGRGNDSPINHFTPRLSFAIFPERTHGFLVRFESRQNAGRELGLYLRKTGAAADVVVGLPCGGMVVAAAVAQVLQRPLDMLVVRKIGHPQHREFAVGALAEAGVMLLDEEYAGSNPLLQMALADVIAEEKSRLREYQEKFHGAKKTDFAGKIVLLVDDGLATGATAEAAVHSARKQAARKVYLAVPVASAGAYEKLGRIADQVWALLVDPDFGAVGQYYRQFLATGDAEVLALLPGRNDGGGQET